MRSVVVVLPASMWAMIPMFRVFSSVVFFAVVVTARHLLSSARAPAGRVPETSTPRSTVVPVRPARTGALPAVVRERLVRLSHPVEVVLPLEGAPLRAQRVEQLVRQPLAHLLLPPPAPDRARSAPFARPIAYPLPPPLARESRDPPDREGPAPPRRHLDRHLV